MEPPVRLSRPELPTLAMNGGKVKIPMELCSFVPAQPKRDVSVWDARDHAVILPWQSLLQVVRAVAWVDGSLERYGEYAWAHGVAFVAHGT